MRRGAIWFRSIRAAGGRRGMKVHVAYGYGLFTAASALTTAPRPPAAPSFRCRAVKTERQVQLIMDFGPDHHGDAELHAGHIGRFRRQGIDPKSSALRIGIFGAEPWGEGIRNEIETAFGIDACDIYGLSEVMGPGVAQEIARTAQGPTIWEDHFLPEVIDPKTGQVAADGEAGELVFTSLTKEGMPVIRYRTRDLTRLLPGTATAMRRIAKITGRTDDMLIIRGVNVFPSQIEELILKCPGLAPHYEIEITRPHRLDEVLVTVEARPEVPAREHEAEAGILAHKLKSMIGISAHIKVQVNGSIQRSSDEPRPLPIAAEA